MKSPGASLTRIVFSSIHAYIGTNTASMRFATRGSRPGTVLPAKLVPGSLGESSCGHGDLPRRYSVDGSAVVFPICRASGRPPLPDHARDTTPLKWVGCDIEGGPFVRGAPDHGRCAKKLASKPTINILRAAYRRCLAGTKTDLNSFSRKRSNNRSAVDAQIATQMLGWSDPRYRRRAH